MNQKILNIKDITERNIVLEKLKNFKSEKEDPWFQMAADFFMISYRASGMNLFDVLTLKWKCWNNDTITYQRRKTTRLQSRIHVEVTEKLSQLIMKYANKDKTEDGYIFPFLTPNLKEEDLLAEVAIFRKTIDKYLKKISTILGITKISYYDARCIWLKEMEEMSQIPIPYRNIGYSAPRCKHTHKGLTNYYLIHKESSSKS